MKRTTWLTVLLFACAPDPSGEPSSFVRELPDEIVRTSIEPLPHEAMIVPRNDTFRLPKAVVPSHAATARVVFHGVGRGDERILVHAQSGALLQDLRTDQSGRVSFDLPEGGLVTWVRAGDQAQLQTIVEPPANYAYRFEGNRVSLLGARVVLDAHLVSATGDRVAIQTADGWSTGAQAPYGVVPLEISAMRMATAINLQVLARTSELGSAATALAVARVPLGGTMPSDLVLGDWKTPTVQKVMFKGLPGWGDYAWFGNHLFENGASFEYDWGDTSLMAGTTEIEVDYSAIDLGFQSESWEIGTADRDASTWALSGPKPLNDVVSVEGLLLPRALPPVLHASVSRAIDSISWSTPGMPMVDRIVLSMETTELRWQILVPRDNDRMVLPVLPVDVCSDCFGQVGVEYLDGNNAALFGDMPPFADAKWFWLHARPEYRAEDFLRGSSAR